MLQPTMLSTGTRWLKCFVFTAQKHIRDLQYEFSREFKKYNFCQFAAPSTVATPLDSKYSKGGTYDHKAEGDDTEMRCLTWEVKRSIVADVDCIHFSTIVHQQLHDLYTRHKTVLRYSTVHRSWCYTHCFTHGSVFQHILWTCIRSRQTAADAHGSPAGSQL